MAQQPPASPAAGGPSSGELSGMQHQQNMAQSTKTGAHNLLFTGSPIPNFSPTAQKGYWEGLIPGFKTSPMAKPGGGINSRAKPLDVKKWGYAPPPGGSASPPSDGAIPQTYQGANTQVMAGQGQGALAGIQHGGESKANAGALAAAMSAGTTQAAMAAVQNHSQGALSAAQSQAQHTSPQMRHLQQMGIGMNLQTFSGTDPLRQQNIFTFNMQGKSPLDYQNYAPVMQVFGNVSHAANVQYQNQMISMQQQAIQAQSRPQGRS